jgi:dCTP deaminase
MQLTPDLAAGTLSDNHIRQATGQCWLIAENFDDARIRQACYELRAGTVYYELNTADSQRHPVRHQLGPGEYILLKPKQFITVITHEKLKLPDNVLGRVLTKGALFSIGVIPVNTYADPGFEGNLGIVLANLSNNYLKIQQLDPIAKIEFSKLRQPVASPYTGQHGYQTQMWPIPYHMILSPQEVANDKRVKSPLDELEAINGGLFADHLKRVFRFERYLMLASAGYFLLSILVLAILAARDAAGFTLSTLLTVMLGVVSNLAFAALMYFLPPTKR